MNTSMLWANILTSDLRNSVLLVSLKQELVMMMLSKNSFTFVFGYLKSN